MRSRSEIVLGTGKKKLSGKNAAIIGVGSTGCAVAQLLARAGLKELLLIDRDIVEDINLEHQILFGKGDVGKPKSAAAARKLTEFCSVKTAFDDLTFKNIESFNLADYDLVIDCTDNAETRLLINDFCKKNKIPWLYTGAIAQLGIVYLNMPSGPCYRCFNSTKSGETCADIGVLNSTVAAVAGIATSIAVNYLAKGVVEPSCMRINLRTNRFHKLGINRDRSCPACRGEYAYLSGKSTKPFLVLCGGGRYSISLSEEDQHAALRRKFKLSRSVKQIKDLLIFPYGKVIITARSEKEARKKYDENVGI